MYCAAAAAAAPKGLSFFHLVDITSFILSGINTCLNPWLDCI